jgi:hypothetical protein
MAEMSVRFGRNPTTGRLDVVLKIRADRNAPAIEHEWMHRTVVAELIGIDPADSGEIVVEREND